MKKIPFAVCCLLFLALGCGSGEDGIIKQQKELNAATAEKVAKAEDLAAMKTALVDFSRKKKAILGKLKSIPREQLQSFLQKFSLETKDSQEQLAEALADFQQRTKKDKGQPVVVMETSMGQVKIALFEDLAPITVKNFLSYVDDKFYDGTIFHRVIPKFMIQGGGFKPGMKEKETRNPIENESYNGLSNKRGTLAMARTNEPNSATAQFFINVSERNHFLDRIENPDGIGYAVFGRVVAGMDVVDQIRDVATGMVGGHENVPVRDVIIKSIRRIEEENSK